jgi:hypothetical protein
MIAYMDSLLSRTDYQPPLEMIWQYRLQMFGCTVETCIGVGFENSTIDVHESVPWNVPRPRRGREIIHIMLGI